MQPQMAFFGRYCDKWHGGCNECHEHCMGGAGLEMHYITAEAVLWVIARIDWNQSDAMCLIREALERLMPISDAKRSRVRLFPLWVFKVGQLSPPLRGPGNPHLESRFNTASKESSTAPGLNKTSACPGPTVGTVAERGRTGNPESCMHIASSCSANVFANLSAVRLPALAFERLNFEPSVSTQKRTRNPSQSNVFAIWKPTRLQDFQPQIKLLFASSPSTSRWKLNLIWLHHAPLLSTLPPFLPSSWICSGANLFCSRGNLYSWQNETKTPCMHVL